MARFCNVQPISRNAIRITPPRVAPVLAGSESDAAWLVNTTEAQRLFGPPEVPLERMIDWTADWVARGMPSLGKDTHFEVRDGNY